MKIKLIVAWRFYPVGYVIDPPAMLGNDLIRRKMAVLVDAAPPTRVPQPVPQPIQTPRRGPGRQAKTVTA